MDDDNTKIVNNIDLHEIDLSELLMVVGSFIFAGNSLSDLDPEIINRLQTLLTEEQEYRLTGRTPTTQVH